jgi:hypothetical protein
MVGGKLLHLSNGAPQERGFHLLWQPPRRTLLLSLGNWLFLLLLIIVGLSSGCRRGKVEEPSSPVTYERAGQEIRIGSWESERPADIVLAIDQSGSMSRGANATDPTGLRIKGSVSLLEFVAGRSNKDQPNRFGVVNFGTDAPRQYAVPLTIVSSLDDPNLQKMKARLVPLDLGDTSFIRALRLATQLLQEAGSFDASRNRAVVIFTDGEPDDPRHLTLQQYFAELRDFLEKEVNPKKVTVFIIGIDAYGKRWSASLPYWRELLGVEKVLTTPDLNVLKAQFNRVVQRIWSLPEVEPTRVSPEKSEEFEVGPYLAAVEFHIFPDQQGTSLRVYRPNGSLVRPGTDPDTPPVKHANTFDRLVIYDPEPGMWRYEAVGGRIEVLRNPIPIRLKLLSPSPVHPQGKPMRLVVEFKRADGKPITLHPDYPLGLSAEFVTPNGSRSAIEFPLNQGRDGVYIGRPEIDDTMVLGEYQIILKVNGGGKYQYRQPANVTVQQIPYLLVEDPTPAVPVVPTSSVLVRAKLLQAGKPLRPQDAFANHPNQLVKAQVIRDPNGHKGVAVWLPTTQNSGIVGEFVGRVPSPSDQEGQYALAITLAPEEPAKQSVADMALIEFKMQYPPTPLWQQLLLWGAIVLPLIALVGWIWRRRTLARLRLPVYYWAHDQSRWEVLTFTRPDETRALVTLSLQLQRIGKLKQIKLSPIGGATLRLPDGREIQELQVTTAGGLIQVQKEGSLKAIIFTLESPPSRRPQAPSQPEELEATEEARADSSPNDNEEFDWGNYLK